MSDDVISAMAAVERWIGNPVSLAFLRFVVTRDECGDRLSNAIDRYIGKEKPMCWKCRLAGKMVGYTLQEGSSLFDVNNEDIKNGLAEPVFKRGLMNVLNGIARYGVTRPQIVNAPFLVVWDFTHMCNLHCKHCYQDAQKALPDEPDTQEAKHLIREMADAGVVVIAFSGGEPLMRNDFFEIAAYARQQGMYVPLASNGMMITPEIAGRLYYSIEPQGDVQPCVFIPIKVGNIRQTPFLEIWHNAEVLKNLRDRDLLTGNCGSCTNKYICGGCRARA